MATTALTTLAQIRNRLSADGVTYRIDDAPDDSSDGDCIDEASQEIYEYCLERYEESDLASSQIVARWAANLGAFFFCKRRANTPPQSIQARYDAIIKKLERVQRDNLNIADIPQKKANVPVLSNVRVKLGPRIPHTVVVGTRSTGTAEGYPQQVQYPEWSDYAI